MICLSTFEHKNYFIFSATGAVPKTQPGDP